MVDRGRPKAEVLLSAETVCATESKAEISAENGNRKSTVSGPKPSASLMPACQGP